MITNEFRELAYQPAGIRQCNIDSLERVEKEFMRIRSWLDVCDIEVFLGPELFERSGNSRIHMFPGPLIRPGFGEAIWINPRDAVSFSLIPLCRSIHPMPSFDPSSSISKVVYVICRVHLDIKDVGNRRNLIHLKVNNHVPLPQYQRLGLHG